MTFSIETHSCEWCDAKDNLIAGTTGDGKRLLVCKDSKACGERWSDPLPEGRVGLPYALEGAAV